MSTEAIEYVPLSEVRTAKRNPKDHDQGAIHASISRFGFTSPLLLDERTGRIVAGHGRVEALRSMKASGSSAPERIEERGGEWYVPVVKGLSFRSDEDAEAYLLADNRLTELGGWDDAALTEILADLAAADTLEGVGWSADDVDGMLADISTNGHDPDEVPEPPKEATTKRGDVWLLGKHRLLCGDSTFADDVEGLLAGALPRLTVTDPPYGVSYDANWRNEAAAKGLISHAASRVGAVENDSRADWREAWSIVPSPVIYCWHADRHASEVQASLEAVGYEMRAQIIWAKPRFAISRGHYHWQHEPCWYAVKKDASAGWIGDRSQTTLWQTSLDSNVDGGHSTQKPVELMARSIRNHEGDVYDPFSGSGSTMMAAEQLGRTCYAMEISEAYCDVICRRYQQYTGIKPVLESTGEAYDFDAA